MTEEKERSTFVPNSFQTPNGYVDIVMPYLTGEEFKVLIYAVRRILGFQKRQDRISLSQFTNGTKNKDGEALDEGTGMSVATVSKCLASLVEFGLMVKVADNNPKVNSGILWSLQWDGSQVNMDALKERAAKKAKKYVKKMEKARSMRHTPPNGIEDPPGNGIEGTPPNGIETQNTEETQRNTGEKISERKAAALKRKQEQNSKKGDPVDFLLGQAKKNEVINAMRLRVEGALQMNLEREWDLPKSDWNGYEKKLLKREQETGQTIEQFMEWYNADDFRRNGNIWLKPSKIEQLWPRAFAANPNRPEYQKFQYDPEQDKRYVPAPKTQPRILQSAD